VSRSPDSAFNVRWRLLLAVLADAQCESTREEWETLLWVLEQRLLYLRHRDQWAA
jgi:hypothetical protein